MAKTLARSRAIQLRIEGKSVKEIARLLQVSTSSVSIWCRDIQLSSTQSEFLRLRQIASGFRGRQIGADVNRKKKQLRIEKARIYAATLWKQHGDDPLFLLGIGLYWGEGSKTDKLSFSNSDPAMVRFMMLWLQKYLGVSKSDFVARVYINNIHHKRATVVQQYWIHYLTLPERQFRSTCYIYSVPKKRYDNHDIYFGILALRVRRSTVLKYIVLALLARVKDVGVAQLVRAEHS